MQSIERRRTWCGVFTYRRVRREFAHVRMCRYVKTGTESRPSTLCSRKSREKARSAGLIPPVCKTPPPCTRTGQLPSSRVQNVPLLHPESAFSAASIQEISLRLSRLKTEGYNIYGRKPAFRTVLKFGTGFLFRRSRFRGWGQLFRQAQLPDNR